MVGAVTSSYWHLYCVWLSTFRSFILLHLGNDPELPSQSYDKAESENFVAEMSWDTEVHQGKKLNYGVRFKRLIM